MPWFILSNPEQTSLNEIKEMAPNKKRIDMQVIVYISLLAREL